MSAIDTKKERKQQEDIFETRYKKLNAEQRRAVDTIEGPLLVVAGPGSGKTELLSLRTANILREAQVSPHNILLLTFTDSGAQAMRKRLVSIIGDAGYRVAIYTFHSFASDIITRYGEYFFNGARFTPVGDADQLEVVESILEKLPRKNPLSSYHPEQGFVYKYDILSCVSALKKGNLSPSEFRGIMQDNVEIYKKTNKAVGEIFKEIAGKRNLEVILKGFSDVYNVLEGMEERESSDALKYLLVTLGMEMKISGSAGTYKNLTAWRDKYFVTGDDGLKMLKDSRPEKLEKWFALADVYEAYTLEMYKRCLYDYDDMIFLAGRALEDNTSLRNELEEQFQYIMIDEFQDTNQAQFDLVKSLTSSPINEGRPNVMAVGDDDQAIYKFQGAELSNIFAFRKTYRDVKLVTLLQNYRSTQDILDRARQVMTKAENRLETHYADEIKKELIASNEGLIRESKSRARIVEKGFDNQYNEMEYIAREIKTLLTDGVDPKEITVISKSHANLREFTKLMNEYSLPYSYEKKENVFEKQPIHELITIALFVADNFTIPRAELLPEILSYKFWGLDRIDIWRLAEAAKSDRDKSWLTCMLESENEKIKQIGRFLIELSADAQEMPLEHLLDKIIGTREWEIQSEYDDTDEAKKDNQDFISPYRDYYFGEDNFRHNKPEYLDFLFSLRTLFGALREYKQGALLKAQDLKDFVAVYTNNNLTLSTISPFATSESAVVLQTAHKSKGLEYEYVFIMNSDEEEWNGRGRIRKIGLPAEMKLFPDSDNLDDRIRLYYVAMTRSKHTLVITNHKNKFGVLLGDADNVSKAEEVKELGVETIKTLSISESKPFIEDEKVLLKRLLENYKMPVTHLTNFLNIGKVGPGKFIEQNLLRFPEAMSANSVYGTAMHEAVQHIYIYYKNTEKMPSSKEAEKMFENALRKGVMTQIDYEKFLEFGKENIVAYLKHLKDRGIKMTDIIERNFSDQGVVFDGVYATGKIDRMEFDGNSIVVTDFKTGKSFEDIEDGKTEYDKIKLHFYEYQLAYYAILVQNSREYHSYKVDKGFLSFLDADKDGEIKERLVEIDDAKVDRVKKLAKIVYDKIMNLDFPDTSHYMLGKDGTKKTEASLRAIEQFEEDLLEGRI